MDREMLRRIEEWERWMSDIDDYVHNDSKWNIIEYGH